MTNQGCNSSIRCSVDECTYHCNSRNNCSLTEIQVGSCKTNVTSTDCTECASFVRGDKR